MLKGVDKFFYGYVAAALWSSTCDDGVPMDGRFSEHDIDSASLEKMRSDCADFAEAQSSLLSIAQGVRGREYTMESAGIDFWLTRNGHGAGFWDRGLGKTGDALSDAARVYGGQDLYVGDDGKLYVQ